MARFTFLLLDCYSSFFLLGYGLYLTKYFNLLLFSPFSGIADYLKNCVRNAEVRSSTLLYSTNVFNNLGRLVGLPFFIWDKLGTIFARCLQTFDSPPLRLVARMRVTLGHPQIGVSQDFGNRKSVNTVFRQPRCRRMPQIVKAKVLDARIFTGGIETLFDIGERLVGFRIRKNELIFFWQTLQYLKHLACHRNYLRLSVFVERANDFERKIHFRPSWSLTRNTNEKVAVRASRNRLFGSE